MVLIFMKDGNANISYKRRSDQKVAERALFLIEILINVSSKSIETLEVVNKMLEKLNQLSYLHQPHPDHMTTSGSLITPEDTKDTIECAEKMYQLAREAVPNV